jgi:regulator of protease activity HflC (stomatin/prohibitin superfamily)
LFAFILWIAVAAFLLVIIMRASRNQGVKGLTTTFLILLVVAAIVTVVSMGLVFIQPEERGVVISALSPDGIRQEALQPGLRFVVPFAEQVITYPISRQTYTMSASVGEGQVTGDDSIRARTKDGQEVLIDASVIYSIDPTNMVKLHINWQDRYQDNVVRPLARGIIRDMASQYGVEEIVSSKRAEMEAKISAELVKKLGDNQLLLTDFILRDLHFSDQYAAAVEQKQIAEQLAQQAAFVVQQKKQEAEQARQTAQGQADSAVIASKGAPEAIADLCRMSAYTSPRPRGFPGPEPTLPAPAASRRSAALVSQAAGPAFSSAEGLRAGCADAGIRMSTMPAGCRRVHPAGRRAARAEA